MQAPGRLVAYQDHLFINELNKGPHVIDDREPAASHAVGFITVPGNTDVTLYAAASCWSTTASNQLDMLDLSDMSKPSLIKSYPMQSPHWAGGERAVVVCLQLPGWAGGL